MSKAVKKVAEDLVKKALAALPRTFIPGCD